MSRPSLLFVDVAGIAHMQRLIPQLQVHSELVNGFGLMQSGSHCSFEITHQVFLTLPPIAFTRHRLLLAVADAAEQPLLLEAGFLSLGRWIFAERNPANAHLPSLTPCGGGPYLVCAGRGGHGHPCGILGSTSLAVVVQACLPSCFKVPPMCLLVSTTPIGTTG